MMVSKQSKRVQHTPTLISVQPTRPEHKDGPLALHPFSHSRLTDMSMCPTWGVVHSQRRYRNTARAMALEAGGLMHEVFAAIRLWQVYHRQDLIDHAEHHGMRIFGAQRWQEIDIAGSLEHAGEPRDALIDTALRVLHTADWYDEPGDDIRTMSNMELAAIGYADERLRVMDDWPIWISNPGEPTAPIGTEQVFDVTLEYTDGTLIRFIGTVDGLVIRRKTAEPHLDENKTASRLDEAWQRSFDMAHQVSGYCASSTAVFGFPVMRARILGVKIKPSKRGEDTYVLFEQRTESQIRHWGAWVYDTVQRYQRWKDDFENAVRFTHSCNRYFRPCALISFCADTPEGRVEQWEDMEPAPMSPSELAIEELSRGER